MDRFNHDERLFCFILATRTGGLIVNITGGDTVVNMAQTGTLPWMHIRSDVTVLIKPEMLTSTGRLSDFNLMLAS